MLASYFKIAFKVLLRRKFFTAISLFGIAFTLTIVLAVAGVSDHAISPSAPEVRLDRTLFLTHMYLSMSLASPQGNSTANWQGNSGYALLDRHARGIPGVERVSIYSSGTGVTSYLGQTTIESTLRYTDAAYWEILDFEFLEGGPYTAEDLINREAVVVISEATRLRYFGAEPALNRFVETSGQRFRVVGVVANVDFTRQSAVADMWAPVSLRKIRQLRQDDWFGDYSAMLLAESRKDFPRIKAEFESRMLHVECPEGLDSFQASGTPRTRLEELAGWTGEQGDTSVPSMSGVVWGYLGSLAIWLLLPTINLVAINLSRIIERSSEIGVRKAFGASTVDLVGQFVVENVFLCLVGGGLAVIGAVVLRELNRATGLLPYTDAGLNLRVLAYALAAACLFGVLTGLFPAWRMSRLHPVSALRGGNR
jgi:putative ABC transport system permease protein